MDTYEHGCKAQRVIPVNPWPEERFVDSAKMYADDMPDDVPVEDVK
jgi:hypothetical protein